MESRATLPMRPSCILESISLGQQCNDRDVGVNLLRRQLRQRTTSRIMLVSRKPSLWIRYS